MLAPGGAHAVPIRRVGRRIYFDQHIPRVIDKRLVAAYIGLRRLSASKMS
jgi:hypothetical protein